jgi:phosphoribosylamine--glycine ligase
MKILIVGSGAREHALAWKLKQDAPGAELFIAPGNVGTQSEGQNVAIAATDIPGLTRWAKEQKPDLTIVGPEAPLWAGIVDAFDAEKLRIFGPDKKAARLEASKAFTKEILLRYGIPTARSQTHTSAPSAIKWSQELGYPQAIKADGLAAGKGVILAQNAAEAEKAIERMMVEKVFGESGAQVVIEEFLEGREISLHVVCDGVTHRFFPIAQDHKRVGDGNTGENTGGMGAYAPVPWADSKLLGELEEKLCKPLFAGFAKEGITFKGVLFAGLMITAKGPYVLEFNVRFGDPETQSMMPLLQTPLAELAQAVADGELARLDLRFFNRSTVGIVMAAERYPAEPVLGDVIHGLDTFGPGQSVKVFHGGTKRQGNEIVTSGGRVLTVAGWDTSLERARQLAYEAAQRVQFRGAHYRKDISTL